MKKQNRMFGIVLLGGLVLAACGGAPQTAEMAVESAPVEAQPAASPVMEGAVTEEMQDQDMGQPEGAGDTVNPLGEQETAPVSPEMAESDSPVMEAEPAAELPAYFNTVLAHPTTGEQFTIKDQLGKVILVENMAMWCSTCLRQQNEVKLLHETLGERDDFISLGLDIDPNENAADLAGYLANNGFDWLYAVAPPEALREVDALLGTQFLNPPSAPMYIIDRSGAIHPLPFGVKSAAELGAALEPFLNEGM